MSNRPSKYKRCLGPPVGWEDWRRHAQEVMRRSRCCLDLTPAEEEPVLAIDNGDWEQEAQPSLNIIGDVAV